ncbi:MAG: M23 family metallopeptidase [Nitrospirota bacterium]|jgi:murein DD-endopeptidase MepM/ murein hydrolase activator NlpD
MYRIRLFLKRLLLPVTIMLIPHSSRKSLRLNVPLMGLLGAAVLSVFGAVYVYSLALDAFAYRPTKEKLDYYQNEFAEIESTISSLKLAEKQFRKLFSLGSKDAVLENMSSTDMGALDADILKKQIEKTMDSVAEIRDYLSEQRDLYMATPMGWPVKGWISSGYGYRIHPITGRRDFHTGMDISARPGDPVDATADGIVIFAGRSGANGNLVAIGHGFGYTTYYAHNKKIAVKVGDVVKRGDVIAYVGSTGRATGPHVHYEIWKDGKNVNPKKYLKGGTS